MRGYGSIREALAGRLGIAFDEPEPAPTVTTETAPDPLGDSFRAKLGIESAPAEEAAPTFVDIGQGVRGTAAAAPASPFEQMREALDRHMEVSARRRGPNGDGGEPGWRRL